MKAITKAAKFMKEAHDSVGQKRKDGAPYWTHPLAVYDVLTIELGVEDETAQIAALLHDVVEDTPIEIEQIASEFGQPVADMVKTLTKDPVPDKSSAAKAKMLEKYYAGLRA